MIRSEGPNEKGLAWGLLILLSFIWGSSFIIIKKGLLVFSPAEVGSIRLASAALFLLPLTLPRLRELKPRHFGILFLSGLIGSFIPAYLFAWAQTNLDSSITGILNALTPLFVLIIGFLFFGMKLDLRRGLGLTAGFLGAVVLILAGTGGQFGHVNAHSLLIIIATICYGLNLNIIRYYLHDVRSLTITGFSLCLVGPISLFHLFTFTPFTQNLARGEEAYWALAFLLILGIVGTALALIIANRLIKLTSPVFTSTVTYLIPIVAVMWGVWDGEILLLAHYLGMAAIIGGVYITNYKK